MKSTAKKTKRKVKKPAIGKKAGGAKGKNNKKIVRKSGTAKPSTAKSNAGKTHFDKPVAATSKKSAEPSELTKSTRLAEAESAKPIFLKRVFSTPDNTSGKKISDIRADQKPIEKETRETKRKAEVKNRPKLHIVFKPNMKMLAALGIILLLIIFIANIHGPSAAPTSKNSASSTHPKSISPTAPTSSSTPAHTASTAPAAHTASATPTTPASLSATAATIPALKIEPSEIIQGEPVMISIAGMGVADTISNIQSAILSAPGGATTSLYFTSYSATGDNSSTEAPTAPILVSLYGTGIFQKTGTVTVVVTFKNGKKLSGNFTLAARTEQTESLPVAPQVGGNSVANQQATVSDLDEENNQIAAIVSQKATAFWSTPFAFPVKGTIVVTDPYGYERDSGAASIIHKGTDFKAPIGTPIYAINDGLVMLTQNYTEYGNTIIIDHGLGVESLYMHLSKFLVVPGTMVKKGDLIGLSGETGDAVGPHLHLSIKINGDSIDPMKFFALFGTRP